jgi:LysM repeat protein
MRRLGALAVIFSLAAGSSAAVGTYTLRAGDTLSVVAKRFHVTLSDLVKANHIKDANRIQAGQVLNVPIPMAPASWTATKSPIVIVIAGGTPPTVVVGSGDSLAAIAQRHHVAVGDLAKTNNIKNPNLIRIGQRLTLPGQQQWICPVQGKHNFTDTWGAPREGGMRHLGTDVFAARGTPVVAPVSGTLRLVQGAIGGNAFYIDGDDGNTYYGAHLDAYRAAPGRIDAGNLVGIVGNTGDARTTPTHLHFELKPGGGPSVDSYYTLKKWC